MTKKDYETVAHVLHVVRGTAETAGERDAVETVAKMLCGPFLRENPRFDRARFLAACGVAS